MFYYSSGLDLPPLHPILMSGIFAAIFGAVGFLVPYLTRKGISWLVPPLEVLGPGELTQWERSRKWVITAAGAIVITLVGAALKTVLLPG
jgi:hypothetical protein